MRRLWLAALLVIPVGCAPVVEEAVLAEPAPVIAQEPERAPSPLDCEAAGDDGIGGTGCPAVD